MGGVFGGRLAEAGNEVWLVDVWREHVDALNRDGLYLEAPDGTRTIPVKATTEIAAAGTPDLVLVFVKGADTPAAAEAAGALAGPDTLFLTLQNGLGHRETIAAVVGEDKVIAGISFVGANLLGPGKVRQTSGAESLVGETAGPVTPRIERLVSLLREAGLPARASDNIQGEIWGKLMVNAIGNATCAVTGYTVGELIDFECSREWVRLVGEETAAVAHAQGIRLPFPDPAQRMYDNCRTSGRAKPSMLQDIEKGRWTEVDYINGAVVRAGERAGVPTPYNQALTLLVKMLEARQHGEERVYRG
jgi:2-dehydropantoate 2-reductase